MWTRAVAVAVVFGAGCGGGDDGGGGGDDPDARPPVTIDASVDATPDADQHGEISITVLTANGHEVPEAGADVVIVDGDGTQSLTADGEGKVRATVLPGASVTVVHRTPFPLTGVRLATVFDVKPGDQLTFGTRGPALRPFRGEMTFHAAPLAGAASHGAINGCAAATASAEQVMRLPFAPSCGAGPHDILLVAETSQGRLLAYKMLADVPFADGAGPIEIPGDYIPASTFEARFEVPPSVLLTDIHRVEQRDGLDYHGDVLRSPVVDGVATHTMPYAPVGDRMRVKLDAYRATRASGPRQTLQDQVPSAAAYTLDMRPATLPWLVDPRLDMDTWTITFAHDASEATQPDADGLLVRAYYQTGTGTDARRNEWFLMSPPTTTAVRLPVLPAALAGLGPDPARRPRIDIDLVDREDLEGYDAARPAAELDFTDLFDHKRGGRRIRRSQVSL